MFDRLEQAADALEEVSTTLEPECLHGADAARLLATVDRVERLAASLRTRLARRVETSNQWRRHGHRSPDEWLAATTGMSRGQAAGTLATGRRLEALRDTREAFERGELSEAKAKELTEAAEADPSAEARLLDTARHSTHRALRDECRRVKAAAETREAAEARLARIHRDRYLQVSTDHEGAVVGRFRATPAQAAPLLAALEARTDTVFRAARREGRRERRDAYALDALVSLAEGGLSEREARGPKALVHVLVDQRAGERGHAEAGETCEIEGIGPVPVAALEPLLAGASYEAVATDGTDVFAIAPLGRRERVPGARGVHEALATGGVDVRALSSPTRHVPAALRSALVVRDRTCVVPGCSARRHLERDHYVVDFARGGPSAYWNLARLCPFHHRLKTRDGYRLEGRPGAWRWVHPDGRVDAETIRAGPSA